MRDDIRKKIIFTIGSILIVIAVFDWGIMPIIHYKKELSAKILKERKKINNFEALCAKYEYLKNTSSNKAEQSIKRDKNFTLFSFLERLAAKEGLKKNIAFIRPSEKVIDENMKEENVDMRINAVKLSNIINYIYYIESAKENVQLRKISIRPQSKDKSVLDVDLSVFTLSLL